MRFFVAGGGATYGYCLYYASYAIIRYPLTVCPRTGLTSPIAAAPIEFVVVLCPLQHAMPISIESGNPVHGGQLEIAQCHAAIIGDEVIRACPVPVRDVGSLELRGDAFVLLGKGASCWRRRGAGEPS